MRGRERRNAYSVYLIFAAASAFFYTLVFTVSAVYRVEQAGLNPFQLVLVGTVLEASVFLFEIPTGVVADVYSRRLSVIIGVFLVGAGFLLEGALPIFWTILLAQALWGIGYTFTSGAVNAWISDEIGEEGAGRAFLRGAQLGQAGALLATGVSVALASVRLNLPILAGGGCFALLGLYLILRMPERHFTPRPPEERSSWQSMRRTLREGARTVRGRPVLITILAIGAIYGMASEAFDRLWPVHFLDNFTFPQIADFEPVVWFGIINAVAMVLSAGVTEIARRRVNTASHRGVARALLTINLLLIGSVALFGLAQGFTVALAAYWLTYLLRTTHDPLYTAWINQRLEPRVRATVLSIASQADALGQIAGGPVLGAVATLASIPAAMIGVALALVPSLGLYTRALRRPEEVEAVTPAAD
ncbi:MAG: MFS transporter [Sphaerobacter thermophilus]|uniref:MFS transporter n=1 Tax=Sphaerobacter thermophilus TaxID=2057 RepID=UPI00396E3232